MALASGGVITLGEEVEGDYEGTNDFLFFRIGASVPLTPSCSPFDLKDAPQRPIAVSERFGLLFLAHSEGFIAAKTKDVIRLAKDIKQIVESEKEKQEKEKAKHPSIQESSVVDLRIGRVSILALDKDSSSLAAVVGGKIQVYSVPLLLKKDAKLLFSHSLGESGSIRDFSWCEGLKKSFTLLSTHGYLYSGDVNGNFHSVMDNVDAVSWSRDGNFIAVARKHRLSILSGTTFEELNYIPLVFNTVGHVKVDSVKWICPDIIIIGFIQLNDDSIEDGYIVQVINTRHGGFKVSSQADATSFSNIFHGFDDLLPSEGGLHLLVGHLPRWGLALVANSKNVDDHVVLLELPVSNKRKKPTVLELAQEKFTPRIELQENGDENLVMGLAIDRTSLHEKEKLEYVDGEDIRLLSPYYILLCLSSEGKLILFHVTRLSDTSIPFPTSNELSEDIDNAEETSSRPVLLANDLLAADTKTSYAKRTLSAHNSVVECGIEPKAHDELHPLSSDKFLDISSSNEQEAFGSLLSSPSRESSINEKAVMPQFSQTQGMDQAFTFNLSGPNAIRSSSSMSTSLGGVFDSKKTNSNFLMKQNNVSPGLVFSRNNLGTSYGSMIPEKIITDIPPHVSGISTVGSHNLAGKQALHSTGQRSPASFSPAASGGSTISVHKESLGAGKEDLAESQKQLLPGMNSSQDIPVPFYRVDDMVKELDGLLLGIERGGLAHLSTIYLMGSVSLLEKDLLALSEKSKSCKDALNDFVGKVQHLQDKMVQISAWEVYMEGIVKQASNCEYWDIWNRQKLGPEFELKQQQILKGNQNLRNQLLELEKHFNMLELNKFGESGVRQSRRALHISETSRQIQMLHSLHSTVVSQLAAAEHLSDCLSRQMASLNITSVKRHSIARELLESIGVEHNSDSFSSPDERQIEVFPEPFKRVPISPSSSMDNRYARRNASTQLKSSEPETARRTRDSLDRNWDNFEPIKTTVKRMSYIKNLKGADGHSSSPKKGSHILTDHKEIQHNNIFDSQARLSISKWARDASESPEFNKSNFMKPPANDVAWKRDINIPSLETASPTIINNFQNITPAGSYFNDGSKCNQQSPGTLYPLSNIKSNSQAKISTTSRLPSAASNTSLSMSNPSLEKLHVSDKLRKPGEIDGKESSRSSATVCVRRKEDTIETSAKTYSSPFGHENNHVLQDNNPRNISFPSEMLDPVSTASNIFLQSSSASFSRSASLFLKETTTSSSPIPLSPPSLAATETSATSTPLSQTSTELALSTKSITVPPSPLSSSVQNSSSAATPLSISQFTSLSSSVEASTASSPSLVVSPILQVKTSSPVPNIGFENSVDTSKPVNSMVTRPASEVISSQAPFSSGSVAFLSQKSDVTSFSSSASTNTSPVHSGQSVVSSLCDTTVSSADNSNRINMLRSGSLFSSSTSYSSPPAHDSLSGISSAMLHMPSTVSKEKVEVGNIVAREEDDMEEEILETPAMLSLGSIEAFGLGSSTTINSQKSNPFGGSFAASTTTSPQSSSLFSFSIPSGQIFKPASFSIPSAQPAQSSSPMSTTGVSGGLGCFGQPSQIGLAKQALGSVLGTFGQTRQLGGAQGVGCASSNVFGSVGCSAPGLTTGGFNPVPAVGGFGGAVMGGEFGAVASSSGVSPGASPTGGFAGISSSGGGFAGAARGGGFAALASNSGGVGGGFAALASNSGGVGGGFAARASNSGGVGGGFAALASNSGGVGGGFAALASNSGGVGGGFAALASTSSRVGDGFAGLASNGGAAASSGGGYAGVSSGGFGNLSGAGKLPAELMQMRK